MGRLKRNCNDMGELMAALVKYADSDNTKDPQSNEEKAGKGKKNGNAKGQQHNAVGRGNNGKRKQTDGGSDFVANTSTQNNNQCRKGKSSMPWFGGPKFNLEAIMNQPCPKHGSQEKPTTHLWKDCFIMREYRNSGFFQDNHGPHGGSGSGSHGTGFGGGGSNSGF